MISAVVSASGKACSITTKSFSSSMGMVTTGDRTTTNVRCRFDDPLMQVPANRSIGLVIAGDDGLHQFRYGMFGADNSPRAFGHAGAYCQVAWADPATGVSFAFVKNGYDSDMFADAVRVLPLSNLAAAL